MIVRNDSTRIHSPSIDNTPNNHSNQLLDIPNSLPVGQDAIPLDRLSPANNKVRWRSRKLPTINQKAKEEGHGGREVTKQDVQRWKERKQRLKAKREHRQRGIEGCPVCSVQIKPSQLKPFGPCRHMFCSDCLSQQVRSCLQSFKLVRCLNEDCLSVLQVNSPHIKSLGINQQERYYKALVFANLANDSQLKLCPTEDCEGFINIKQKVVFCPICGITFCRKCLMPAHPRECDENGVFFLQGNFHFRKCGQCQMVLEKNQGCNHMTCRCGYQFCYLCGGQWANNHNCTNPLSIQILVPVPIPPPPRPVLNHSIRPPQPRPDQALNISMIALQRPRVDPPHVFQISARCICSFILFHLMRGLVVIFTFFCLGEAIWMVFILTVVPILACVVLIGVSLWDAGEAMVQEYSCKQIAIGNIFLYLFCFGCKYGNHIIVYFKRQIWECMWNTSFLFPFTTRALALIESLAER